MVFLSSRNRASFEDFELRPLSEGDLVWRPSIRWNHGFKGEIMLNLINLYDYKYRYHTCARNIDM